MPKQEELIGGAATARLALEGAWLAFCQALNCPPSMHLATAVQRMMPEAHRAMVAVAGRRPWRKPAMAAVDDSRANDEARGHLRMRIESMITIGVRRDAAVRALAAL